MKKTTLITRGLRRSLRALTRTRTGTRPPTGMQPKPALQAQRGAGRRAGDDGGRGRRAEERRVAEALPARPGAREAVESDALAPRGRRRRGGSGRSPWRAGAGARQAAEAAHGAQPPVLVQERIHSRPSVPRAKMSRRLVSHAVAATPEAQPAAEREVLAPAGEGSPVLLVELVVGAART